MPTAAELAHIAKETANVARRMGHEPRVAFLSYSTFGNPPGQWLGNIREAVALLDADEAVNFEYEGEMAPDAALNPKVMALYPFSRLSGPANVLVMPGLQSANLSAKLLRELGGNATIGPMLIGMEKPVQVVPMTAIAPDVLTLAVLAAAGITAAADDPRVLTARMTDVAAELPPLLDRIRAAGCAVEDVEVRGPSLQAVFIHLTGRELRE